MKTITIRLPDQLAKELPQDEFSISEIMKLGLKQLKIEKSIEKKSITNTQMIEYPDEIKRRRDIWISPRICQKLIEALDEGVL